MLNCMVFYDSQLCVNLARVECPVTESAIDLGSVGMAFVEVTQVYKQCSRSKDCLRYFGWLDLIE